MYTFNKIIPEEIQSELIQIRDDLSANFWRIGEITNFLIDVYEEKTDLAKAFIYSAVGMFIGKASRTVREYAMVERRFTPEIRNTYPELTFDHFRQAVKLGDNCMDAIEWAALGPQTVDSMLAKFASTKTEDNWHYNIRTKADAFVATLSPLLETPLREEALTIKNIISDFMEKVLVLEKVI